MVIDRVQVERYGGVFDPAVVAARVFPIERAMPLLQRKQVRRARQRPALLTLNFLEKDATATSLVRLQARAMAGGCRAKPVESITYAGFFATL